MFFLIDAREKYDVSRVMSLGPRDINQIVKVLWSSPYTRWQCGKVKTIDFDESFSNFRENAIMINEWERWVLPCEITYFYVSAHYMTILVALL